MKVFDFFEQNTEWIWGQNRLTSFDKIDELIFNEINEMKNL